MMAVMRLIRDPNAIIKGEVLHRGRDLMKLPPSEMRAVRGGEIAMIFQDPMTALTPVYTVGWQIAEQLRAHEELTKKQARAARDRAAGRGRHLESRAAHRRLPAPVLGRHAAARDDRDGALVQPVAADRRRADDGARRDDPGADPGADEAAPARPRLVDPPDHARHGRRLRDRRAGGRHVRRAASSRKAPKRAVFRDPQHPYTWGLLGSIPRVGRPRVPPARRRSRACRRRRSRRRRAAASRRAARTASTAARAARAAAGACRRAAPTPVILDPAARPALRARADGAR